jgi:hypothetical protein
VVVVGEGVPPMANKDPRVNGFQLEVRRKSKSHQFLLLGFHV